MIRSLFKFATRAAGFVGAIEKNRLQEQLDGLLIQGETVEAGYKLVRDAVIFTNKRVMVIDVQGITGRKSKYRSIPYREIATFEIESAGTFDADAELKIWLRGQSEPAISLEFVAGSRDVIVAHEILSQRILA